MKLYIYMLLLLIFGGEYNELLIAPSFAYST